MTTRGGKIKNILEDELKRCIEIDMDSKPHWRLVVAIEYKNGLSPAQIEAKYGISKNNVYTWLDRFEERGV